MKFRIKLKDVHENSGLTYYRVARQTGITHNTVQKYAEAIVEQHSLPAQVLVMCKFYGVDWRDPAIVEVVNNGNG